MHNCKPRFTLCEMNINKINKNNAEMAADKFYSEIVGSLSHLIMAT